MHETLHTVIWFELWVDDVELARQFYGDLFGWTFAPMAEYDPQHWLITAGEGRGTIGALWPSDARPSDAGAVVYVAVASLDASVTRHVRSVPALSGNRRRFPTASHSR